MTLDRTLGGAVALGGAFLLVYLIPNFVEGEATGVRDPSLFPRIAGSMLLVLGVLQVVFARAGGDVPSWRELARLALLIALMSAATFVMPIIGFMPSMMLLMAAAILVVFERRPLWIVVTVCGLPAFAWFVFEEVLKRPLP